VPVILTVRFCRIASPKGIWYLILKCLNSEIPRPWSRPRDDTIFFCHPERAKRPRDLLLILKDLKLRFLPSGDAP